MTDKRQSVGDLCHRLQESQLPNKGAQGVENLLLHPRYVDELRRNLRSNLVALAAARGKVLTSAKAMTELIARNPERLASEQAKEILAALERAGSVLDAIGRAPLSATEEDIEVLREVSRVLYDVVARAQT